MNRFQILANADIVTMDPETPSARSVLIHGGRIMAVGELADVKAAAPGGAPVRDMEGKTIVPGFIETHNHLSYYAMTLFMADCSAAANQSIADVLEKVGQMAAAVEPGAWVVGWGYDDTLMQESRHLHKKDLDETAPNNPVFVLHASGHLAYVSSSALELGGIDKNTPQPDGGEIHKDDSGEPTGLLLEPSALMIVGEHLPKPDAEAFKLILPEAAARYNREGITSVHDGAVGMAGHGKSTIRAYRELEAEGRLNLRVYLTTMYDLYDSLAEAGMGPGFGSETLKLGSVKMFQDGSIQGLTAALSADYHNKAGHKGEFIMPQEDLDALVAGFHSQGMQIACHANGDAAIESVISAMERAQKAHPLPPLRHMIIHCQTATDDHISRMKALGIIPSYFPNHVYYWGDRHEALFLGPERAARINPLASSVKAGLRFTLHADTPVTPISPLHSIHSAVNRLTRQGKVLGPDERISPYDALKGFTADAAYAGFEENMKGAIRPGLLADFAVLSGNPLTAPPESIKTIQVLETIVGGKTVYQSDI